MIRVLVADDHVVVREGIKRILADTDDIPGHGLRGHRGPHRRTMSGGGRGRAAVPADGDLVDGDRQLR